jgi:hypothetical protein
MKKKNNLKFNNGWSFAIVNSRLAEIHFAKGLGIWAHCYVKRSEFSKGEQKMIDIDIKKCVFSYKKGFYYDKIRKLKCKVPDIKKIFPDLKTKRFHKNSSCENNIKNEKDL